MNNLYIIITTNFTLKRYPQILKIAPNDKILQQFIDLLNKYIDNDTIIINIEEGHFKFWLFEKLNNQQIRYIWGKIGGTVSIKDIVESKNEAFNKRRAKLLKGYKELI